MKKLWIFLVALALLAAAPIFADVTVSGEFMGFGYYDFAAKGGGSSFPKAELNIDATVDDFNTVKLELDSEGGDWASNVAVDDFRVITDFGAALGLPVSVKTTVGYFDTYFTGWYYYEPSGWTWYYDWPNKLVNSGPLGGGAVQLDLGFGPVNVHLYDGFDYGAGQFMLGVDAAFAGLSAYLAYGGPNYDLMGGDLSVEAAYAIMDIANASVFFRYGLGDKAFTTALNVGADFGMLHAGAGLEGDSESDMFLDNIVVEASVAPVEAATILVAAYMDLGGTDAFAGLDVSGRYKVGAAEFVIGYAYAPEGAKVSIYGDNTAANGLYAGAYVPY